MLGTRDYLGKNGFTDAVIGLSGGIDSSLVATVAVDALGPSRVHGISMPSRYSSDGSRDDAEVLAERLGIDLKVVPIEEAHVAFSSMLAPVLGREPSGLTDENLQSRLRGVLLMAVSNAKGWIVLTTGNKSEMATGYSTLYGDSAGGFAVIKDVPKTLVYDLCRYRNTQAVLEGLPGPIPDSVLDKPPSAELRPDQRDDQSLPPYEELDPVLQGYVERDRTAAELVAEGFDPALVDRVVRLVDGAEYKRRQMPPGRAHHHQGLRQGPPHADHQPLPLLGPRGVRGWLTGEAGGLAGDRRAGRAGRAYCWLEQRLFAITGDWASGPGSGPGERPGRAAPDGRSAGGVVTPAGVAGRRTGWSARLAAPRLLARGSTAAGAGRGRRRRAGDGAQRTIWPVRSQRCGEADDAVVGVGVVAEAVLPWLAGVYLAHLRDGVAGQRGPVLEVLVERTPDRRRRRSAGGRSVVREPR